LFILGFLFLHLNKITLAFFGSIKWTLVTSLPVTL
jgi:hypothetical protein